MEQTKNHNYIQHFKPMMVAYSSQYQNYFDSFNAGKDNLPFEEFIQKEAEEYADSGDGVTYLIFDTGENQTDKKLVAYFTICSGAIPYVDRWEIPKDEREENGLEYDEKICGIPAIELKMFAVSKDYQDLFYRFEDEEKPIAAWILMSIVNFAMELKKNMLGVKAIFLRSVPDAENFYKKNGFDYVLKPMNPFYSIDSEYKAMFLPFVKLKIHYDE